ncbi:sulfate transporter family-domain-containing protein [Syncephalis fuscata]|nr:sulfate transporter family-domain-containing protein [Syncephalis fuscata]
MTVEFNNVLGVLRRQARRIPSWLADRVPIVRWLPRYNRHWILGDIVSGLTVGIMVVPQGLAYAKVGSLPMEFGLYTAFFGAIPYVFFGTCKDMNIGPSAVLALQTGMVIRQVAAESGVTATTAEMAIVASTYTFDFISNPVVVGFTSGVSLNILIAQLPTALGIKGVSSNLPGYRVFINISYSNTDWLKSRLGKRWAFFDFLGTVKIPVVVIVITSISVVVNRLLPDVPSPFGILRRVPHGFPDPVLLQLLRECTDIYTARLKKYKTDTNQELFALGVINIVGSFFRAYPNMGTFSRSLVNSQAGARSPFTSLFCGIIVLCALLFLPPAFYYIPDACLATIIIVSVSGLIVGPRTLRQLWRVQPWDMVSALLALVLTVATNVATGILAAVGLSLIIMLHRIARPHFVVMERLKNSPSIIVIRLEEALIFPNAYYVREKIMSTVVELTRSTIPPLPRKDQPWCGNTDYNARERRKKKRLNIKAEKRYEMRQKQLMSQQQRQREHDEYLASYNAGESYSGYASGDMLSTDDEDNAMDYLPELPEQPLPRQQFNPNYSQHYPVASRSMYPTVLETVEERSCETDSPSADSTNTTETQRNLNNLGQSDRQSSNEQANPASNGERTITNSEHVRASTPYNRHTNDDVPNEDVTHKNQFSRTDNNDTDYNYESTDDDDDANTNYDSDLPFLRAMIFDFRSVNNIDASGLQMLFDLRKELYEYSGAQLNSNHWFEMHFVAVKPHVLRVLELSGVTEPMLHAYQGKHAAKDELTASSLSEIIEIGASGPAHPKLVHPSIADAVRRVNESLDAHVQQPNFNLTEMVRIVPEQEWMEGALDRIISTTAQQTQNTLQRRSGGSSNLSQWTSTNQLPEIEAYVSLSELEMFSQSSGTDETSSKTSSSSDSTGWHVVNATTGLPSRQNEENTQDDATIRSWRFTAHSL